MAEKKVSFIPVVRAEGEDEIIDHQQVLREKCALDHHAAGLFEELQTCNERVRSRKETAETCKQELFDYLHALDHCVTKDLWAKLK